MTYTAFDPRDEIIDAICDVGYDDNGEAYHYVPITADDGDTIEVRVYNGDDWELPPLPCVRVDLASSPKTIRNVGGDRIQHKATIHFHVFATALPNCSAKNVMKRTLDALVGRLMANRNLIENLLAVYPTDVIDRPRERENNRIILHRILEVQAERFE